MDQPAAGRVARRDKEGRPLTREEWEPLRADFDYVLVAETWVGDQRVRTVWEGHDVAVLGDGAMFHSGYECHETGNWRDAWKGHHPCTVIEAEAAHELVVAKVREQQAGR